MAGRVFLVGAGPGDPKLITWRGLECLQEADVIVYDRLVDERLLGQAKAGAELIYVGKASSAHTMSQDEINALLVAKGKEGKTVVRLKGGDPYMFGRGGEEAEELVDAGVEFEVVPGVTSAIAVPAYAGIPVTHRKATSTFTVITGHEAAKDESALDWGKLAGLGTLVFLMGVNNLPHISKRLLEHGQPADTPVAVIERGTTAAQKTLLATLGDVVEKAREAGVQPPAITIVGGVAKLREKLRWFDKRPLFGMRVLVTRSRDQASALANALANQGAQPIELPSIEVKALEDNTALDGAVRGLNTYQWVAFTSANGVRFFFERVRALGLDARALAGVKVAAIGPATAAALRERGIVPDVQPKEYVAEALAGELGKHVKSGDRVLLPRVEGARDVLARELTKLGALVSELPAYQTVVPEASKARARELLVGKQVDIATFTSSSTVRNLVELLDGDISLLKDVRVACIGPVTAATARELGLRVDAVARDYTVGGLVNALLQACEPAPKRHGHGHGRMLPTEPVSLDETDWRILRHAQSGFPLSHRPFADLGEKVGLSEAEALERIRHLCSIGALTRFGPVLSTRKLGGNAVLAAMQVPPERLEEVGDFVSRYREVTHNYEREGSFNLWFVVSSQHEGRTKAILREIEDACGVKVLDFPRKEEFFIGAEFSF